MSENNNQNPASTIKNKETENSSKIFIHYNVLIPDTNKNSSNQVPSTNSIKPATDEKKSDLHNIIPGTIIPDTNKNSSNQVPSNKPKLFHQIIQKYEISKEMAIKLEKLNLFKIALILDDSGSMNSIDHHLGLTTRWEELKNFTNTAIEIIDVFNSEGCDIYFLNRPSVKNIKSLNDVFHLFRDEPLGGTPLTNRMQQAIEENIKNLNGKKLLLIIATDGEPTDNLGNITIPEFAHYLNKRPSNVYTTIIACTDDINSIGYLNGLDRELPRLDICREYRSEYEEVRNAKGSRFKFSYGDYIAKSLIGSIDDELDKYDGY